MKDRVEYYSSKDKLVAAVDSATVPVVGSYISIRGETWKVASVSYALDHADSPGLAQMRANVELEPAQ